MKIVLRPHLVFRLKQREIPQNYPEKILRGADNKYMDNLTGHNVAIKTLEYYGKKRPMAVVYDIIGSIIQVITVYPTTEKEIKNRVRSGRWVKNEKN